MKSPSGNKVTRVCGCNLPVTVICDLQLDKPYKTTLIKIIYNSKITCILKNDIQSLL